MIEITSTLPHCLGKQIAADRLHELVATLSQRFPQQVHQVQLHLRDQRVSVSFTAYGYAVTWEAEVTEDTVQLRGQIPDSAKKFRNKIEQAIVSRVEPAFQPSTIARAA